MGLFYSKESKQQLIGYANVRYLMDPHKAKSQTGYVFNCNGTVTSRKRIAFYNIFYNKYFIFNQFLYLYNFLKNKF